MKTIMRNIFVILIVMFVAKTSMAQDYPKTEVFESKYRAEGNPTISFELLPTTLDGNEFWVGGKITAITDGHKLNFVPKNIVISSKNVELLAPINFIRWWVVGKEAEPEYRFKFKLKETYKGEKFTITFKDFNILDDKDNPIKINKADISLTYNNLPAQKSSDELKEAELVKLNDTLTKQLKKIENKPSELESKIKLIKLSEIDAADTERLKKVAAELRVLKKQNEVHRSNVQKIINQCKDERLSAVKTEAGVVLKKNKDVAILLETMLKDDKISKIQIQEEKKVRDEFLPLFKDVETSIVTLAKDFEKLNDRDNSEGIKEVTKKVKAQTITKDQARKTVELFLSDSVKYVELKAKLNDISARYTKAVPQLDDLDSLLSHNEKSILELETQMIKSSNDIQDLKLQAPPADNSLIYIIIGIVLAGGVLAYFGVKILKSRNKDIAEEKEKEAISEIEIVIDDTKTLARGAFSDIALIAPEAYIKYEMSEMWQHSFIKICHIHKDVVAEIYKICRDEQRKAAKSGEAVAPEIGGFLIGRYLDHKTEPETYDLVIDQYLQPSETEHQDVYQIKFGTVAMHDLDKALELNPDKALVGWFHTHPGHSPFLSQPDLNIHNGTFTQNWQIAIVVDPYNEYDTGIFTRYRPEPGKRPIINNNGQLKWLKWNELHAKINRTQRKSNLPQVLEGRYFTVEMSKFWADSKVAKVHIAYDIVFDLEELSLTAKDKKDLHFAGMLYGYFDETESESGVYQIYLNQLVGESANAPTDQAKVAWLGVSAQEINTLQSKILEMTKLNIKNPYEIGIVMCSNGLKLSFLSVTKANKLNYKSNGDYFLEFAELNRWTMKKQ